MAFDTTMYKIWLSLTHYVILYRGQISQKLQEHCSLCQVIQIHGDFKDHIQSDFCSYMDSLFSQRPNVTNPSSLSGFGNIIWPCKVAGS